MKHVFVVVYEDPRLSFYRHDSAKPWLPDGLALPYLVEVGSLRDGGGETSNASVVLEGARLPAIFAVPPLRTVVEIYDGDEKIYQGVVNKISLGLRTTLDLEG